MSKPSCPTRSTIRLLLLPALGRAAAGTRITIAEDSELKDTLTRWFQRIMKLSSQLRSSFLSSVLNSRASEWSRLNPVLVDTDRNKVVLDLSSFDHSRGRGPSSHFRLIRKKPHYTCRPLHDTALSSGHLPTSICPARLREPGKPGHNRMPPGETLRSYLCFYTLWDFLQITYTLIQLNMNVQLSASPPRRLSSLLFSFRASPHDALHYKSSSSHRDRHCINGKLFTQGIVPH